MQLVCFDCVFSPFSLVHQEMSSSRAAGGGGKANYGKDLFSIQLEITEKLLEAEEKKLRVLKTEIEASKHSDVVSRDKSKVKELEQQENNYLRIKMQQQRLAQEMQDATVTGLIQKKPKLKASRSLPAFVMKPAPKPRPSVFDHLVPRTIAELEENDPNISLLQQSTHPPATRLLAHGKHSEDIEYREGVLVAGSLEALIEQLIPTETHYPERSYMFAFILCSRLFLRPYELLARVSRVFHMRQKQSSTSGQTATPLAINLIQLLGEWTETFPYDFRDERMMKALKEITQTCAGQSAELRKSVGQVQSTLVKKLSILDKYEHVLAQVNAVSMERLIDPKTQVNIQEVCGNPSVLAQQLTHIEMERLNNIGPEEFIETFVKYPNEAEPLYRDMKKTNNLEAYVEWFNRLSYLVATEICVADRKRNRARLIEFFADTAVECRKLNNFNSCMAISAGLFMSPVTRLRKTRTKVNNAKLQEIETLVDPIHNFSAYRQCLNKAISQANQAPESSSQKWVVPFFSLIVKDIYFLHQGMNNRDAKGYIRFEKCISLARLVSQILGYKSTVLPFPRQRSVLNYLMTIPVHTDDELQLASFEIEPPENSGERKRHQELKLLLGSFGGRVHRSSSSSSSSSMSSSPPVSPSFSPIQEES